MKKKMMNGIEGQFINKLCEAIGDVNEVYSNLNRRIELDVQKRTEKLNRKVENLTDTIRVYEKSLSETAHKLGNRCSQIRTLANDNKFLRESLVSINKNKGNIDLVERYFAAEKLIKNLRETLHEVFSPDSKTTFEKAMQTALDSIAEWELKQRVRRSVSILIPTAGDVESPGKNLRKVLPESSLTADDMVSFGISVSPNAVSTISNVVKNSYGNVVSKFRERIRNSLGDVITEDKFVVHKEFAIPYITFGYNNFDACSILVDWMMADPKKRIPNFSLSNVVVFRKPSNHYRIAYTYDKNSNLNKQGMMFFVECEYREVIKEFCRWYNNQEAKSK